MVGSAFGGAGSRGTSLGELPWNNLWQLPYGTNNPAAAPDDFGPHRDILFELFDSNNQSAAFWASNILPPMKSFSHSNMMLGYHDDIVSGFAPVFSNRAKAGLVPAKTSYGAHLVDNFDLLSNLRGYPSTQWDGHVPWDTADYRRRHSRQVHSRGVRDRLHHGSSGRVPAQLRSLRDRQDVPMDLRRSNWIELTMHLPSAVQLGDITTLTSTAEDADGNEPGAIAFFATPAMSQDGLIDGHDASSINSDGSYAGGIVIEGWKKRFFRMLMIAIVISRRRTMGLTPQAQLILQDK